VVAGPEGAGGEVSRKINNKRRKKCPLFDCSIQLNYFDYVKQASIDAPFELSLLATS
jgi:predicted trehalose synthase